MRSRYAENWPPTRLSLLSKSTSLFPILQCSVFNIGRTKLRLQVAIFVLNSSFRYQFLVSCTTDKTKVVTTCWDDRLVEGEAVVEQLLLYWNMAKTWPLDKNHPVLETSHRSVSNRIEIKGWPGVRGLDRMLQNASLHNVELRSQFIHKDS